jgi:hypothetical protein
MPPALRLLRILPNISVQQKSLAVTRMPRMHRPKAQAAVVPPMRKTGGAPLAKWRQDVTPTVIAMAAEMGPDELTARAVAQRMGLQDPQIWRALPKGRADILFLIACDLQVRQTDAVRTHDGLRKRSVRARVEAHLARMLTFDFDPSVRRGVEPARRRAGTGPANSTRCYGATRKVPSGQSSRILAPRWRLSGPSTRPPCRTPL